MLNAKMSGIMPALLTLSGRNVEPDCLCIWPPLYMLRPYCTGMRLCASLNSTITNMIPKANSPSSNSPPAALFSSRPWPTMVGKPATMPPNMINEIPLPSPRSDMSSPSHTRNIVPATMDISIAAVPMFRPKSTPGRTPDCLSSVSCPQDCRNAMGTVA